MPGETSDGCFEFHSAHQMDTFIFTQPLSKMPDKTSNGYFEFSLSPFLSIARWDIKWTRWINFHSAPSKKLEFYLSLCVLFNCDCNADGNVCESIWKGEIAWRYIWETLRAQLHICLEMKFTVRLKRLLHCLGFFLRLFSAWWKLLFQPLGGSLSLFLPRVLTVTRSCPLRRHTHLLLHAV